MNEFNITLEEIEPYCKKFNKQELDQALVICKKYHLSPVKRQIMIQKRWTKNGDVISPLVTIDGLRAIAERSRGYAGQDGAYWCGEDGKWTDVWLKSTPPLAAKVGVFKDGFKQALYAVAKFEEYKQLDKDNNVTGMWVKMPDLMIAKCAEALALRRAFPDELGGLYTVEEMEQADNPYPKNPIAKCTDMRGEPEPELEERAKQPKPEVKMMSEDEQAKFVKSKLHLLSCCAELFAVDKIANDIKDVANMISEENKAELREAIRVAKEDIRIEKGEYNG